MTAPRPSDPAVEPFRHGDGRPRRIALVHDWLTGMRGGERVLAAIAAQLPLDVPIYTLLHVPGSVDPALEARPIRTSFVQRLPRAAAGYRRYLPLFPAAIEDLDLTGYELVISTSHCVAKGVVTAPDAVHVCYCHTPMRYAWDQEHVYFPRRRGPAARLRGLILTALRAWDAASASRVDAFAANSHFVATRIRRYYGRDAAVLAPPVEVERFAPATNAGADDAATNPDAPLRLLLVSALAPYKRVDVAIEAANQLGLALRIVGDGPERARLARRAGPTVTFLGQLSRDDLVAEMRGADRFLQPGVEDFGIAPVEALAARTPVVARGRGGVRDIVDDGVHGVLYGPPGPADEDFASSVAMLRDAIDKSRQIRFNPLDLDQRAQRFSRAAFDRGLRSLIAHALCASEGLA
ncbi:MAG: glycosyltransferase [Acidobacteriota bacterium]